jgi:hypothetical protein
VIIRSHRLSCDPTCARLSDSDSQHRQTTLWRRSIRSVVVHKGDKCSHTQLVFCCGVRSREYDSERRVDVVSRWTWPPRRVHTGEGSTVSPSPLASHLRRLVVDSLPSSLLSLASLPLPLLLLLLLLPPLGGSDQRSRWSQPTQSRARTRPSATRTTEHRGKEQGRGERDRCSAVEHGAAVRGAAAPFTATPGPNSTPVFFFVVAPLRFLAASANDEQE